MPPSNPPPPTEQFTNKYTKANPLSAWLIKRFFATLSALVREVLPGSIIEVGCGPGYSTEVLRAAAPNADLRGCDLDEELLKLATQRVPGIRLERADIHRLPYETNGTDLAVCLEVLEHVDDPSHALSELARITRSYAILSVPREPVWRILNMARGAYWRDLGNTPGHINHWSTAQFRRFAEKYFDVVSLRTPLPWTMLLLKKRA